MTRTALGDAIRRLRMGSGLRQRDAAAMLGVNATYLSHLEAGRREPSLALIRKLYALPDVPVELRERFVDAVMGGSRDGGAA